MFFRKGRGTNHSCSALCTSSMPTCSCEETSCGRRIRRRAALLAVMSAVIVVVLTVKPVPWDVVLPVLATLAVRG